MPEPDKPLEDPVLRSSRREAIAVFITWLGALAYTVTYCALYGYGRPAEDLKFVTLFWGIAFPDWVFWGIIAPWSVCFLISYWFSYVFMTDEELGEELEESDDVFAEAGGEDHA
jgi:hypothetical protein